jgi:hypothetical protein
MNWLVENWPWLLFGAAFVALHLGSHGGHGGHGSHRPREGGGGAVPLEDDTKPPHVH